MNKDELIDTALQEEPTEFEMTPPESLSPLNEPLEPPAPGESQQAGEGALAMEESRPSDGGSDDSMDASGLESPTASPALEEEPLASPGGEEAFAPDWEDMEPPPLDDAPEQPIGEGPTHGPAEPAFELPLEVAAQTADTFLGIANNLIEVGGGYFVRIPKDKSFYEYEEIVRLVDDQSQRNIQKIKLDEEDKALLRPLIIQVLRQRAMQMTPEQQLVAVIVSILVKKTKVVIEIRQENLMLRDQIRDIVQQAKASTSPEKPTPSSEEMSKEAKTSEKKGESLENEIEVSENNPPSEPPHPSFHLAGQVMEVAEEEAEADA